MKARLENGKVVKYKRLPKAFKGTKTYLTGFDIADTAAVEAEGFYDVVVPTYDKVTQVIYNLHMDSSYPAPTPEDANATRTVFTYDVKDRTISQTLAELKTSRIQALKRLAHNKLEPTDWMVTRKAEKGTAIPSAKQTERDNIRSTVATKEGEINALTTKAAVLKYDISF